MVLIGIQQINKLNLNVKKLLNYDTDGCDEHAQGQDQARELSKRREGQHWTFRNLICQLWRHGRHMIGLTMWHPATTNLFHYVQFLVLRVNLQARKVLNLVTCTPHQGSTDAYTSTCSLAHSSACSGSSAAPSRGRKLRPAKWRNLTEVNWQLYYNR